MTKEQLQAENERLGAEVAALRDLLTVIAGARPPMPVKPEEMHRFYSAASDRLLYASVAADEVTRYKGGHTPAVAHGHAQSLREYLAKPLRYEAETLTAVSL